VCLARGAVEPEGAAALDFHVHDLLSLDDPPRVRAGTVPRQPLDERDPFTV
jgi:hypothetical protein